MAAPEDNTTEVITTLRTARTVEHAASEWTNAHRAEHYLWDDKRLTATLVTLGMTSDGNHHNPVSPVVALDEQAREFLDASARRVHTVKQRQRRRRTATIWPCCRRCCW